MSTTFSVGQRVHLAPPPHAFQRYSKQLDKELEIVEVVPSAQSVTATTYIVRLAHGGGEPFDVPEAHLRNTSVIVRARSECVGRRDLASLFSSVRRFSVPLYQRKYCWERKQWQGLWDDLLRLEPSGATRHGLGRVVVYEERWEARPAGLAAGDRAALQRTLLVVDGQQRLTTCALLLAALHHEGAGPEAAEVLFPRGPPPAGATVGEVLDAAVLVPTNDDREAFARALRGDAGPQASRITGAYEFFRDAARRCGSDEVAALAQRALRRLEVLYFELDDGEAVARFFEQLHQRQMMLAKMLRNGRPGVDLAEVDLLRNFVLGHFGAEEERAAAYRDYWLEIERAQGAADGDLGQLGAFLEGYLARRRGAPAPGQAPSLYAGFCALFRRELEDAADCEGRAREVLADILEQARSSRAPA